MSLAAGARFGSYEVVSSLGAGGMGEVYRAKDSKLKREVALKVLPADVANDRERLARFQREAEVLASLNHPNIAHIHGLEESNGTTALVMELVEGEDLSARIARGAIPLDEALPIAKQIAEALEAAHEQGIIHRDLKPANIKVRADGTVKVLDFGLAKAMEPGTGTREPGTGNALANSPTITSPAMTMHGVILGTAAYMSPEQAKGKTVDKRADIWAFGCVLFEMLTARTPFAGETITDIIAEIVKGEPKWQALDPSVPPRIRTLLERCLQKDPRARLRDIGDARLELEAARDMPSAWPAPRDNRLVVSLAAALALVTAALALFVMQGRTSVNAGATLARLTVTFPPRANMQLGLPLPSLAVSPDGRKIVYTASGPEGTQLWMRDLDRFTPAPLAGTRGGRLAFFSPDGKWIGFLADGKLKKIPVTSGPPIILCDAVGPRGGTWTSKDEIVFAVARQANPGLYTVPAAGGTPRLITGADVWFPDALPGGNVVVVTIDSPNAATSGDLTVAAIDLTTGRLTRLFDGGTYPRYAGSGHLLFLRNGTIMAAAFDPATLTVGETRTAIIDEVYMDPSVASGNFAVSAAGVLAYAAGDGAEFQRTLVTAGADGVRPILGEQRFFQDPRLAPDGRRIAVTVRAWRDSVWVIDAVRATFTRVTSGEGQAATPVWTPDGRHVIYSSTGLTASAGDSAGAANLFRADAEGNFREERLTTSPNAQVADSVSADGKWLVFTESVGYATDLFLLSLEGNRTVRPLLQTRYDERSGAISADGRWLAYQSNRSGDNEVYVADFPAMVSSTQISTDGGAAPVWARDGRHLYYRRGQAVMAVDTVGTNWIGATNPRRVADVPRTGPVMGFDVMPDGRFLTVDGQNIAGSAELRVVLNWSDELRQKVPTP